MSLFKEQDYAPTVLSPRWFAVRCRPNMLLQSHSHIISILESGLMFREDSAGVEQSLGAEWGGGGGGGAWLTRGERQLSAAAVCATLAAASCCRLNARNAAVTLGLSAGCVVAVRATHRALCRSSLSSLLAAMSAHTLLARRMLVCLKEYKIVKPKEESISSALSSAALLLGKQHGELATLLARCSLALLAALPWLRDELPDHSELTNQHFAQADVTKIHHTYLVMQSSFLKLVAMAHLGMPKASRKLFDNHNERLYFLHKTVIEHLQGEIVESHACLERMYRIMKNCGNSDPNASKKGIVLNDSWLYSEVHAGVSRATIELKMVTGRCNDLDVFLDNTSLSKSKFDVDAFDKDLDSLIEALAECLNTLQNSQIKLKKIQSKLNPSKVKYDLDEENIVEQDSNILKIEDKDPETRDEVFYFVKTENDDNRVESSVDVTTGPGKKERDNTKIVISELKKKLVKREDMMRAREKVALENTMPELRGKVPEFPRQIEVEDDRQVGKGSIHKLAKIQSKRSKISQSLKRKARKIKKNKYKYRIKKTENESNCDIQCDLVNLSKITTSKGRITFSLQDKTYIISKCIENYKNTTEKDSNFSDSSGLSDVEGSSINNVVHQAINKKYNYNSINDKTPKHPESSKSHPENSKNNQEHSRRNRENEGDDAKSFRINETKNERFRKDDFEFTPSSSESDFEFYNERKQQMSLLKDIRRHRAARKKNHPTIHRPSLEKDANNTERDESLKPVEYSFGIGMALASVVQGGNAAKFPNVGAEEVFVGDGEVSHDSGNDEDA